MADNPSKIEDYPLAEKVPEQLKTPSGVSFTDINLEALMAGKVQMEDLRIAPESLERQAQIADCAGRNQLSENLRRAAELASVPEGKIMEVYAALRPGRAEKTDLLRLAAEMEEKYHASRCARFIREAAEAYFGQ